jgi:hypothetical protein
MQIPSVPVTQVRHSHVLQQPLAAPRAGIMLHYDDSSRDDWALAWFDDPRCTNGYTWLALEDGDQNVDVTGRPGRAPQLHRRGADEGRSAPAAR